MIKKIVFGLSAVVLLLVSSCTKKYTCDDFRTGTYTFSDTAFKDVTITRTEAEQIEVSTKKGNSYSDVYEIRWEGPCSYSLVFKSTDNMARMPFSKMDTIKARIVDIGKDGYLVETSIFDKKPKSYLIKED